MSSVNLSLLSLSIAASNATRIPTTDLAEFEGTNGIAIDDDMTDSPFTSRSSQAQQSALSTSVGSAGGPLKQHRRLSSTGRTKRRMSDARDAAGRPSSLSTSAGLSLASLSLSAGSDPSTARRSHDRSVSPPETAVGPEPVVAPVKPIAINGKKKRGLDYKCETCSKIYRHPSCLIKHRWEHTPHWREASKYVLSKHQQVQLLEAAAILSHLSPAASGTSLPEDRSLWPSFLCGGSLPTAEDAQAGSNTTTNRASSTSSTNPRISSSVPSYAFPERSRSGSAGPRMHDYNVPVAAGAGITQVRPGVLSVSRSQSSSTTDGSPMNKGTQPISVPSSTKPSLSSYRGPSSADPWSLSSSSARSGGSDDESVGNISRTSQRLRARDAMSMEEEEASEEEEEEEEEEREYLPPRGHRALASSYSIQGNRKPATTTFGYNGYAGRLSVKEEDEDGNDAVAMAWDGGDMEMEMD